MRHVLRALGASLLIIISVSLQPSCGSCVAKQAAPRWTATIEQRSTDEFVLLVIGDVRAREDATPMLLVSSPPSINPRILNLSLLYTPIEDARLTPLLPAGSVRYEQPVGSPTAYEQVIVSSEEDPPACVPVSSM